MAYAVRSGLLVPKRKAANLQISLLRARRKLPDARFPLSRFPVFIPVRGSVAIDVAGTKNVAGSVSTIAYSFSPSASLSNGAIVAGIETSSAVTSMTAKWDTAGANQTMTLIGSQNVNGTTTAGGTIFLFGLRNPTTTGGAKIVTFSWTTASIATAIAASFTGVNQTSDAAAFKNFNSNGSASAISASVAITSAVGDIVFAMGASPGTISTMTGTGVTSIYSDTTSGGNDSNAARYTGAATVTPAYTTTTSAAGIAGFDIAAAAAGTTSVVEQGFFDVGRKLKLPTIFEQGPFAGTSPPLSTTFATSSFFDPSARKRPVVDNRDALPPKPTSPALDRWFDLARLKPLIIDNPPILFPPAAVAATASIVEQPFFEPMRLLRPGEFSQGPFAGTSPPLNPYITQAFFDQIRLKQPIIDKPSEIFPLVVVVNFSANNWFDAVKLFKVPDRFPDFGAPFPARQALTAWFESVRKQQIPGDFPFTATGAVQLVTIQNALMDWFPQLKMKQPIIDPGLVVYFPAQVAPPPSVDLHNRPFFATVGSLMGMP